MALLHRANLKEGQTALILGAAGGVGIAAVQVQKFQHKFCKTQQDLSELRHILLYGNNDQSPFLAPVGRPEECHHCSTCVQIVQCLCNEA